MNRIIFKLFFFCLLYCPLVIFSEGLPLSNTDGGAPSIVNKCVSVISGDYIESSCDLKMYGPEPLTLERYYNGNDYGTDGLYGGWHHNHESKLDHTYCKDHYDCNVNYTNKDGRHATYSGVCELKKSTVFPYQSNGSKGFTNLGSGVLSARTHIKNSHIKRSPTTGMTVKTENGSTCYFANTKHDDYSDVYTSYLVEEKKCTGNVLSYEYQPHGLKSIKATGRSLDIKFSEIKFNFLPKKELDRQLQLLVEASDGRKVIYKIKKFPRHRNSTAEPKYRIEEVIRPNAPYEKYKYIDVSGLKIRKKKMPEARFLSLEYYGPEKLYSYGRVKKLFAPVGFDPTPVMTYEFVYDRNCDRHGAFKKGVTYVYDAKRQLKAYWCNEDLRISEIIKYRGTSNHGRYSSEHFYWSDEGNVLCHLMKDEHFRVVAAKSFTYDAKGNVIKDSFFGTLKGSEKFVNFDEAKKKPIKDTCDRFTMNYRYSDDDRNLLLEEIWPNGKSIQYTYKSSKDLIKSKLTLEHGVVRLREFYEYDNFGSCIKFIKDDGLGRDVNDLTGVTERKITRTQNSQQMPFGLPLQIEDSHLDLATGSEILFKKVVNSYSIQGNLLQQQVFDANNVLRYTQNIDYDAHGNVIRQENPLGQITVKSYNRNDELIYEKDLDKKFHKEYVYDFSGRKIAEKECHEDGTVLVISNVYDHLNQLVARIDPFGQKTEYEYDEFGRQIKIHLPVYTDPLNQTIASTIYQQFDVFGNITSKTDPLGNITTTTYNCRGQPTKIVTPGGAIETREYHSDGTIKKLTAKNGLVTLYTHDCLGRLLSEDCYSTNGELLTRKCSTYNSFHKLTDTDAKGVITYYSYTLSGLLKSIKKENSLTEFEYDEFQRLHATKQWVSKSSYLLKTQKFDLLARVIEEASFDENNNLLAKEEYLYDAAGNKIEIIQEREQGLCRTITCFDSHQRPIKLTDPLGNSTFLSYEYVYKNGQKVLITHSEDALGIKTSTEFNIFGKVESISKKNSYGKLIAKKEIGYDAALNPSFTIESAICNEVEIKKIVTKWAYNEQHLPISITEAADTEEQKFTSFSYNAFGEKLKTIKPDGNVVEHTYDSFGRLKTFFSKDNSFSYSYEYDRSGNLIKSLDLIHNQTTYRDYDALDNMIKETLGTGFEVNYSYDQIGRPLQVVLPDDSSVGYEYDALRLREIKRYKNGVVQYSHAYTSYDLAGNLLEEEKPTGEVNYQYNLNSQLENIDSRLFSEKVTYDAVSNLTSYEINQPSQNLSAEFTYDDLYQLKSEQGIKTHQYCHDSLFNCVEKDNKPQEINSLNQLLKTFDQTYGYDNNGNRTSDDQNNYTYDALDRLTSVSSNNKEIIYTYDSFNRRLSKIDNGNTTHFLYFGQNEVGSIENGILKEFRTLGTGKGAEIGATIAIEIENLTYIPFHDHNGNISCLQNLQGEIIESYRYSAFGEEFIFDANNQPTSNFLNPWRFASKRIDTETGLINFGRRFYDCKTAKWMSPDPLGFEAGPNLYAYVSNNPLTHYDLYGLIDLSDTMIYQGPVHERDQRSREGRSDYSSSYNESDSRIVSKDSGIDPNKAQVITLNTYTNVKRPESCIVIFNGICTDLKGAMDNAENLSKIADGVNITAIFDPTRGWFLDTLECIQMLVFRMETPAVKVAREYFNNFFKNAPPDAQLLVFAHSKGGITIDLSREGCEWSHRIHVVKIGSASYSDPNDFASVVHYRSISDIVPLFDQKGKIANKKSTHVLKPHKEAYGMDHNFDSPTYDKVKQRNIQTFKDKYGDVKI